MQNRQERIHSKGFDMINNRQIYEGPIDYGSIKVGTKTLDDAVLNLGFLHKHGNPRFCSKPIIYKAMAENDISLMREISNYFYKTSGIYSRVCDYFAYLYRYDWYIVPEILVDLDDSGGEKLKEKMLVEFNKLLSFLDSSHLKTLCGQIALEVVKNGAYYGYIVPNSKRVTVQQLPVGYCRSRFFVGDNPVVEFNMQFFDDNFKDLQYRMKVLKMWPKDIQKGYSLFKQGKLPSDSIYETSGSWYTLEPGSAFKFSITPMDRPIFINAIPTILDLDAAQDLDRRKQMQQLLKILIQKLPLDKNGDLIFDLDEAKDIHNNAVEMLQRAIGVDVLTTFADVSVEDMSNETATTSNDGLEKIERTVYNAFGISRNLFNTDSNLSLEKSILDDESTMRNLLFQFVNLFDNIVQSKSSGKKKYNYRLYMLETTQYNYKDLAKMYKEQVQIGYSKMLPQIAMGHSQSSIINTAYFENEVLNLSEIMLPPLMSSTMNLADLKDKNATETAGKTQSNGGTSSTGAAASSKSESGSTGGRPEKADSEKSAKTIANKESM